MELKHDRYAVIGKKKSDCHRFPIHRSGKKGDLRQWVHQEGSL